MIAASAVLHIVYNLLLLRNCKLSDFASTYPSLAASPLLVTLGAFFLMHQRPTLFTIAGVMMISAGIVFLSTGKGRIRTFATCSALATGAIITAYTIVDGMGVQRSQNTLSYTVWVFASYLLMPAVLLVLKYPVQVLHSESLLRWRGRCLLSGCLYARPVGYPLPRLVSSPRFARRACFGLLS